MPQADYINSRKNYRMEFVYGKNSFKFSLNPEEYSLEEGSRSVVTQTKAGAWIDDFGGGLPKISIRGHTGVKSGGFKKFKALRDFIRKYTSDNRMAGTVTDEMYFFNYTDEEYFVVHVDPSGFQLTRSASKPLLYQYSIKLTVLRKADDKGLTINMKEGAFDYGASNSELTGTADSYAGMIGTTIEADKRTDEEVAEDTKKGHANNTTKAGSFATSDDTIVQTGKSVVSSVAKTTSTAKSSGSNKTTNNYLQTFADYSFIEEQLNLDNFDSDISKLGAIVLKDLQTGKIKDSRIASRLPTDSFAYLYTKLCKNKLIEKHIQERAKLITLECLSISLYPTTFHLYMTEEDLERIVRNIHSLINDLSLYNEYTLSQHFRQIQRCIIGILGCNLFSDNVATQLEKINNAYNPDL